MRDCDVQLKLCNIIINVFLKNTLKLNRFIHGGQNAESFFIKIYDFTRVYIRDENVSVAMDFLDCSGRDGNERFIADNKNS